MLKCTCGVPGTFFCAHAKPRRRTLSQIMSTGKEDEENRRERDTHKRTHRGAGRRGVKEVKL
jgi:hypothetical protein